MHKINNALERPGKYKQQLGLGQHRYPLHHGHGDTHRARSPAPSPDKLRQGNGDGIREPEELDK